MASNTNQKLWNVKIFLLTLFYSTFLIYETIVYFVQKKQTKYQTMISNNECSLLPESYTI